MTLEELAQAPIDFAPKTCQNDKVKGGQTSHSKPKPKMKNQNQVKLSDVLEIFLEAEDCGATAFGGFKDVWEQVAQVLEVDAPWSHFRAAHLKKVGLRFEELTGKSFLTVCPDLREHAGHWETALV